VDLLARIVPRFAGSDPDFAQWSGLLSYVAYYAVTAALSALICYPLATRNRLVYCIAYVALTFVAQTVIRLAVLWFAFYVLHAGEA
ncbi:MAG: hypothetical protein ABSD03_16810, partial [Vulcanimicrobiaceae bacterium]